MVARNIADAGATQRLLVRTPAQAPKLPGATVHASSYSDPDAVAAALDGVEVLFMVSLPEGPDRVGDHCTFVTAAAKAGVKHIIYTSFINAASDTTFTLGRDHAVTEADIKASGMAYTFLRDNFYIDFMEGLVGDDGVIRGPSGDGRTSVVARADVARSAAAGLQNPQPHRNKTYDMTGPEALSMADIAAIFTEVRGQNENSTEVTFHNETMDEARASRSKWGAPDWEVDAWISTYVAIGTGELTAVSPSVETITGQRPMSLREFLAQG